MGDLSVATFAIGVIGALLTLVTTVVTVTWRVGVLFREQDGRLSARLQPIYQALEDIKSRVSVLENEVRNDVTGRKAVAEMRDRLISLESSLRHLHDLGGLAEAIRQGFERVAPQYGERRSPARAG